MYNKSVTRMRSFTHHTPEKIDAVKVTSTNIAWQGSPQCVIILLNNHVGSDGSERMDGWMWMIRAVAGGGKEIAAENKKKGRDEASE